MMDLSMLALASCTFLALFGSTASQSFLTKPADPTYAIRGGTVFLNWKYNHTSLIALKRWYQADNTGNPKGGVIVMAQYSASDPPTVSANNFKDRVTYVTNAGMRIANVAISDEGPMKFDVTFLDGKALQNSIQLIVTIPPTIVTALPAETIVSERSSSRLQCQFDARPIPSIKWFMNNAELNNSRYTVNTTTIGYFNYTYRVLSVLNISNAKPEDTANFACVALLPNMNMTTSTKHIVLYEPRDTKFTSNRANHIGSLGQPEEFTCSAHGNPSIFYQLYKDGKLFRNSTSGVYTLSSVNLTDEGTYSCIPMNNLGAGPRREFNFTVHVSPTLHTYSGSLLKTTLNTLTTISCTFYGEPVPNITWNKYGGVLSNGASSNTTVLSANSSFAVVRSLLVFTKVSKADHGTYQCMASNDAGYLAQNISIDVQYAPEFNNSLSHNYTLKEDSSRNSSWSCTATGNPDVSIKWLLDGAPAVNGFNVVEKKVGKYPSGFTVESTLMMVGILRSKAGLLACNASNVIGSQQFAAKVFINYLPSATRPLLERRNVTLNDSTPFICDINALPTPQIHWEKDGRVVNASDYLISQKITASNDWSVSSQSNLTISNSRKSDFGVFSCVAANSIGNLTQVAALNVLFKVEMLKSLQKPSHVQENTPNYMLECMVVGNPEPEISWFKNGAVYNRTNNTEVTTTVNRTASSTQLKSVLTFRSIGKMEFGNYSCKASNALGSVISTSFLIITYKPMILRTSPSTIITNDTKSVTLFCEVQANPPATVYWEVTSQRQNHFVYTNNTRTLQTSMQFTTTRAELMITNSTMLDNGVYTCIANNSLGSTTRNTTLVVQYKPMNLTSLLSESRVIEGKPFMLNCSFISNPAASVSWIYNGSVIASNSSAIHQSSFLSQHRKDRSITNSSMKIESISRTMRGEYECHAANHQGMSTLKTTLIVDYEPTFLSSVTPKIVLDTQDNITILCKVESSPVSTITWLKDGLEINNNSQILITNNVMYKDKFKAITASSLRLSIVNKSNTGNYSCKAANQLATKYQERRVVVRYSPEISTNFGQQQNLTESKTISFTCIVESHPTARIRWFKDGVLYSSNITTVVKESSDSKTVLQSSLGFPNGIKRADFGSYTCNASNLLGNASATSDVSVWYAPEFNSSLSGQVNMTKYGNASFQCVVDAYPSPSVNWFKDSTKISWNRYEIQTKTTHSSANRVIVTSVLRIGLVVKNDTAQYECRAENRVARNSQATRLNVQYRPQLLVSSSNRTVNQSNEVSLKCTVDANPDVVTYDWTKNGKNINFNGAVYKIMSAENASTATYKCTPKNIIGSGKTVSFGLLVRIPPMVVSAAECKPDTVTNQMKCTCSGKGVPPPYIYWTKDTSMVEVAVGTSFQRALNMNQIDGKYHCRMKNVLGQAVTTSSFYYYVKPAGEWQVWGKCNATCGSGFQTRKRQCNIASCQSSYHLTEMRNCTHTCEPQPTTSAQEDKPWLIALYVIIPVVVVFLGIIIFWVARTTRRKTAGDEVVIPVNGNLSKPPSIRNVPITRRDIYLPEKTFGTNNPAYYMEDSELRSADTSKVDENNGEMDATEEAGETNANKDDKTNENGKISTSDEVDTYLGPNGETVAYRFYNEASTSL